MELMDFLGVVAEGVETFYASISYLDMLYLAAISMGVIFILSLTHVVFGAKASTTRRAMRLSKYFENVYIGSSYEAGKFYRRKKHLMNKCARDEFEIFMRSSVPITSTDFVISEMKRGRDSLGLVSSVHLGAMLLVECAVLMKAVLGGLGGVVGLVYSLIPMAGILVLHFIIFGLVRLVGRHYIKAEKRLTKAVRYIDYNTHVIPYTETDAFKSTVDMMRPERESRISSLMNVLKGIKHVEREETHDEQDEELGEMIEGMTTIGH